MQGVMRLDNDHKDSGLGANWVV